MEWSKVGGLKPSECAFLANELCTSRSTFAFQMSPKLIDSFLDTPKLRSYCLCSQTHLFGFGLIDSYSYPLDAVYSYRPSFLATLERRWSRCLKRYVRPKSFTLASLQHCRRGLGLLFFFTISSTLNPFFFYHPTSSKAGLESPFSPHFSNNNGILLFKLPELASVDNKAPAPVIAPRHPTNGCSPPHETRNIPRHQPA